MSYLTNLSKQLLNNAPTIQKKNRKSQQFLMIFLWCPMMFLWFPMISFKFSVISLSWLCYRPVIPTTRVPQGGWLMQGWKSEWSFWISQTPPSINIHIFNVSHITSFLFPWLLTQCLEDSAKHYGAEGCPASWTSMNNSNVKNMIRRCRYFSIRTFVDLNPFQ